MVVSSSHHRRKNILRGGGGGNEGGDDFRSELARFLLCGGRDGDDDDDADMQSMRSVNAGWYALALEPLEVRNERIIMLFEGYAIFGALFMNAVWVIYEWGYYNHEGGNTALDRAFGCIMGTALCADIFLAVYGAACWMMSVMMDSSNEEFVFESRTMLTILQNLLMLISTTTSFGLFLAVYKHFYPNVPETVVTLSIAVLMYLLGSKYFGRHMATCMPLEFFHFPIVVQLLSGPGMVLNPARRERLKARAKLRAQALRKRAFSQRNAPDRNFKGSDASPHGNIGSVKELLSAAATNLGRADDDVSIYVTRLEEDWFDGVDQLRGRGVDCLVRYMPLRLAEEVHKLVGMVQ